MARDYILYPTSFKGLGMEMTRLVDDYSSKYISEEEMRTVLKAWRQNCDFMLDENGELAKGLLRYIGQKRARVVSLSMR